MQRRTHRGGALALVAFSLLAWLTIPAVPAAADHEPPPESHDAAGAGSVEGHELVEEQTGFPCFRVSRHLFGLRGAGTYEGRTASGGPVVYRGQVPAGGTLNQDGPLQVQVENTEAYYHSPFGTHGTETGGGAGCSPSTVATPVPASFRVFAAEGTVDSDGDKDVDVLTGQAWVYRLDALGAKVPCVAHGSFARGTKGNPTFGDPRWVAEWTLDESCVVVGNDAGTPGTGTAPPGTFHTQHGTHEPCFGDVLAGDCPRNIRSEYKQFLPKPGPFLTVSGPASAVVGCDQPVTVNARLTVAGVAQANAPVTFTVAGPAPAAPPAGVGLTGADGRAAFTFSAAQPGDYVVTAKVTYDGQERVATHTVRFEELPPLSVTLLAPVRGQTEEPTTVRATVRDACTTVAGAAVSFSVAWPTQDKPWTGQPTPSSGSRTTDAHGEASFSFSGDRAGRYVVTASTTLGTTQASATHTADLAVNTLKREGSTPLPGDSTTPWVSAIDPAGVFAYFLTGPNEGVQSGIVKFDLRTFQPVGVLAAPTGPVTSLVISPDGTRAYAGTFSGSIYELDLMTFQWGRTITLPDTGATFKTVASAVVDPAGRYGYFGVNGYYDSYGDPSRNFPGQVLKVDLATFAIVSSIVMEPATEVRQTPALVDPDGATAYFTFDGGGPFSARVVKIDLGTFQRGATALLGSDENYIRSGLIDPAGDFAYFGTANQTPGRVVKVNLKTMARVDAMTLLKDQETFGQYPLDRSEAELYVGLMDPAGRFAYFGARGQVGSGTPGDVSVPARLIRIDLATFQRAESVDLPPGTESVSRTGVIDPSGSYAYVGASKADAPRNFSSPERPGLVAKIALTRAPNPALAADADAYTTDFETPLTVPAPGVLEGDTHAGGRPMVAGQATDPAGGSVTLNQNGSFTYTPDAGFSGVDSFTYTASDGIDYSAPTTVSVTVAPRQGLEGSAFGYYADVSLFGGPTERRGFGQPATAPATATSPSVSLPAGGSATPVSASDPDGATAQYGPAVIFGGRWPDDLATAPPSGPLTATTQGNAGSVTSSARIALHPTPVPVRCYGAPAGTTGCSAPGGIGPGPLVADEASSTCTATGSGVSASASFVNGVVETKYDPQTQLPVESQPIPNPVPINYTVEGTLDHVGDSFRVVLNEQVRTADGTKITVNAAHMYLLGPTAVGEVVIGHSVCAAPAGSITVGAAIGDFDGNGASDVGVYRPGSGAWYVQGGLTTGWGVPGDVPVPADYDGNGTTDVAVFRPSDQTWYVQGGLATQWGAPGDVPVPADYDGDGDSDIAVFRPSDQTWYVQGGLATQWGANGDVPVPADYDGNGTTDIAVFRPADQTWYVQGGAATQWGVNGDVPVPVDFDGDGDADIAVYRPGDQTWYSQGGLATQWGAPGDIAVPADYDGNGRADVAIYRPTNATWYSQTGLATQWGVPGDIPLTVPAHLRTLYGL